MAEPITCGCADEEGHPCVLRYVKSWGYEEEGCFADADFTLPQINRDNHRCHRRRERKRILRLQLRETEKKGERDAVSH